MSKPLYKYLVHYYKLDTWNQRYPASREIFAYSEKQAIFKFENIFKLGTVIAVERM